LNLREINEKRSKKKNALCRGGIKRGVGKKITGQEKERVNQKKHRLIRKRRYMKGKGVREAKKTELEYT